MLSKQQKTSTSSTTHAIATRGRHCQWSKGLEMFTSMPTKRIQQDVISYNVTIGITSNWRWALQILDHMPGARLQRDVISFGMTLDGWHQTLQSLEEMRLIGLEADVICHNSALKKFGDNNSAWQMAMAFFTHLVELRFGDLVTSNTFLNVAPWHHAVEHLEEMRTVKGTGVSPFVISYNAMMTSYERCSHWQKALDLFIGRKPVLPSVVSYGAALSCCAKGNCWHIAVHLLQEMKQKRIRANSHIFSSFILSSESNIDVWQQTLTIFGTMESFGSSADLITCNSALGRLPRRAWQMAEEFLAWMQGRQIRSDVATETSVMACQTWQRAMAYSEEMCQKLVPLNQISSTVLLSSLVEPSAWRTALSSMATRPGSTGRIKSNVLMSCLEHRGRWALTLASLENLQNHQLRCDVNGLTLSIAAAGRATEWALSNQMLQRCSDLRSATAFAVAAPWPKTLQLLDEAQCRGIQADTLMQSAVMESSERAQKWHVAMDIFNVAAFKRVLLDVVTQSCALRSLERGGNPNVAAKVPELLESIGAYKNHGVLGAALSQGEKI